MKIETRINIKYKGKNHEPGSVIDVTKDVAEQLVEKGQAVSLNSSTAAGQNKQDDSKGKEGDKSNGDEGSSK